MAGHSKFKNIMHRKGAQDRKRAGVFAKLAREITVAAKMGGGDPAMNARLRLAVANARAQNMPKDNVERAILKGTGAGDADDYVEIRYEGYGPGGVAVIVESLTDNRNRTAADIRSIFNKAGGNLGETGSVSFMFDRLGEIRYPLSAGDADAMLEAAIEAGAEDVETAEEEHSVYCAVEDLNAVSGTLAERFGDAESAKLIWRPQNLIPVDGEKADSLIKLIDALEDHDDVQTVFANFDISEETMERLAS